MLAVAAARARCWRGSDSGDDAGVEVGALREVRGESAGFCGEEGVEGAGVQVVVSHMNWTHQLGVWFRSVRGGVVEELKEVLEELSGACVDGVEHVVDVGEGALCCAACSDAAVPGLRVERRGRGVLGGPWFRFGGGSRGDVSVGGGAAGQLCAEQGADRARADLPQI